MFSLKLIMRKQTVQFQTYETRLTAMCFYTSYQLISPDDVKFDNFARFSCAPY